jgi:GNAT superfamily N-acetyltransferase
MRTYKKIIVTCPCTVSKTINKIPGRDYSKWRCRSCAIKLKWKSDEYRSHRKGKKPSTRAKAGSDEHREKLSKSLTGKSLTEQHKLAISIACKQKWQDPEYRECLIHILQSPESRKLRSTKSKALWTDAFREKYQTEEFKAKMSALSAELWQDPAYRAKITAAKSTPEHKALMREIQKDPEYIRKLSVACNKLPRVSSIQLTLYSILDDLGVEYYGENEESDSEKCLLGPWSFDCVIPTDDRTLLIECQGDWIHSLPHKRMADKSKATYVEKYFSQTHSLKYLWEHQFASYNGVLALLQNWLGITIEQKEFSFKELQIRKVSASDYRPFLHKYHYLMNAGRGGCAWGAFLSDELIAVCVFSPLPRQNITAKGYSGESVRDLSRLCIHPKYQKKNFGSWFISRCIKLLDDHVRCIVAYADSTFNHNGTVYKASNFDFDGYTKPEYWYASVDGWIMHKKTLYNKASNLGLKESEYAKRYGLIKVNGLHKLRFILLRK